MLNFLSHKERHDKSIRSGSIGKTAIKELQASDFAYACVSGVFVQQ